MEQKTWAIERITEDNYTLFEDMIYWRQNGMERAPSREPVSEQVQKELRDLDDMLFHHDRLHQVQLLFLVQRQSVVQHQLRVFRVDFARFRDMVQLFAGQLAPALAHEPIAERHGIQ